LYCEIIYSTFLIRTSFHRIKPCFPDKSVKCAILQIADVNLYLTLTERLMNHTENLKENKKHRKPPFQQRQTVTRPPLKATNVVTQGQQPRAPATVKQPPTGCSNKKPVKTGEKQHLTAAIKWYVVCDWPKYIKIPTCSM